MDDIKNDILNIWKTVNREGIDGIIEFLICSDFFSAPCSTEYHLCVAGGLAQHSLNVYELLKEKVARYNIDVDHDSIVICGLGHDLCKANFYVPGVKRVNENGVWKSKNIFKVQDQFPYGHGEKSVSILQNFIQMTDQEKLAIRWHMVAFDPGIHFGYPSGFAFREASKRHPLVTLLFTSDYEASNIVEKESEE